MIPFDLESSLIELPMFTGSRNLGVRWQSCLITAAIVRLGFSRQAGHYRVAAFLPNASGLGIQMTTSPNPKTCCDHT